MSRWKEPLGIAITLLVLLGVVVADAVVDRAAGTVQSDQRANLALADLHERTGAPHLSIEILDEISARDGRPTRLELRRAALLVRTGQLTEAEKIYNDLLARTPRSPAVEFNLAIVRHRLGRSDEAQGLLREFLARYGDLLPEHAARAQLALQLMQSTAPTMGRAHGLAHPPR
ncbi:MAG: hypothetical protein O2923_02350 [Verrucomicrobia bacterium]|nr:hypothetical protein [Verrucomicrobiota bacterium]MDA1085928.1 hypothetical protein [Verrucomicrobiota bacterium]